ncbi:ATP-binding protein [Shimia sagamensis]|uniref:ATP-binding protein n=1 Tax=Shimia sagamensis TaxID=1566352 RepID=UPI0024B72A91|nr:adenylate/guanylate cyclase domain-containing protein [Shimia sagamensis]
MPTPLGTPSDTGKWDAASDVYSSAVGTSFAETQNEISLVHEAERRQISILFCDLVESTRLAEKLDPEDMRSLLASYRMACGKIVATCSGTVYQHLGDGIIVLFGHPVAHEDATENAVRAGLQIADLFSGPQSPLAIFDDNVNVRIGINTGRVVIGRDGAGAAGEEMSVIGEVPNLAARLQETAEPGQVVISQFTEILLKSRFVLNDLGQKMLKGFSKPITCFQVVQVAETGHKPSRGSGECSAPLIGRDGELMLLQQHWHNALQADGQVMMLSGEAGVGKSRLLEEFNASIDETDMHLVRFFSSSFHIHSMLRPIVGELRNRFKLNAFPSNEEKYEALRRQLSINQLQHLPILALLFNIQPDNPNSLQDVSPEELKQRTFKALLDYYSELENEKPLLMQFEDVHWCDPTTLDMITLFMEHLGRKKWFLILAFRPDYTPPIRSHSGIASLTLNRFSNSDIRRMVRTRAGGLQLPGELTEQIIDRADGIPLYAEELTRMVLDAGWLAKVDGKLEIISDNIELAVPNSLQDSLMARLDRFPSAKEVAQIAATIGRRFSLELLTIVSRHRDQQLEQVLDQLLDAELIYGRGAPPYKTFEYKHALVQDAAYRSLLRSDRQAIHLRIAQALEKKFSAARGYEPELLGHHFGLGGDHQKSYSYHLIAGDQALASSASLEAINHLENALENLKKTPQSEARDACEFDILVRLAVPQATALGYAHEKVSQSYQRALELANEREDTSGVFPVIYGLVRFHLLSARYTETLGLATKLSEMATKAHSDVMLAATNRSIASAQFYQGQPKDALKQLSHVIDAKLDENQRAEALSYDVVDFKVAAIAYASMSAWQIGDIKNAIRLSNEAIAEAEKIKHPFSQALALAFASWTYGFAGEVETARRFGEETFSIARQYTFQFWIGWAEVIIAWSKAKQTGDYQAGIEEITSGIENWMETRSRLGLTYFLHLKAELQFDGGDYDGALKTIEEAEAFAKESGENFWAPDLARLNGEILLAQSSDNSNLADEMFEKALEIADRFHSKSLKVKALTSQLKMQISTGSKPIAAQKLRTQLKMIEGGEKTYTVKQAMEALSHVDKN